MFKKINITENELFLLQKELEEYSVYKGIDFSLDGVVLPPYYNLLKGYRYLRRENGKLVPVKTTELTKEEKEQIRRYDRYYYGISYLDDDVEKRNEIRQKFLDYIEKNNIVVYPFDVFKLKRIPLYKNGKNIPFIALSQLDMDFLYWTYENKGMLREFLIQFDEFMKDYRNNLIPKFGKKCFKADYNTIRKRVILFKYDFETKEIYTEERDYESV